MPADPRLSRPARGRLSALVAAGCCALGALSGCGALPPQAPVAEASLVSRALTTIAASCGQSYRMQEFTPRPDLHGLDVNAGQSATQLARLTARHPRWVYQGETLTQIAGASIEYLDDCSLTGAARILAHRRA